MTRIRRLQRSGLGRSLVARRCAVPVEEPGSPRAFRSTDELLEGAVQMITARLSATERSLPLLTPDDSSRRQLTQEIRQLMALSN